MLRSGIGIVAAGLLLVGCSANDDEQVAVDRGVEDRTPYEQLDNTAGQAEGYGSGGVPAPVTPVQGGSTVGGPLTATGQFVGVGQNASPGSVTLTQAENGTRMSVLVREYTANARLQVSVARGTCARPGQVVHAVSEPIQIGESGIANLDATVPVPTAQLLDGQHVVRLTAGTDASATVGCAALPAQR